MSIVLIKITINKIIYNPLDCCKILIKEKNDKIIKLDKIKLIIVVLLKDRKTKLINKDINNKNL